MSKTISAGRTPKIEIELIDGDLSLVGWEGDDILIKADDEELRLTQDGDLIQLSCNDDLSLRLPKGASISIQKINGDSSVRGVVGARCAPREPGPSETSTPWPTSPATRSTDRTALYPAGATSDCPRWCVQ
mgnify:CR=1 FL=1